LFYDFILFIFFTLFFLNYGLQSESQSKGVDLPKTRWAKLTFSVYQSILV